MPERWRVLGSGSATAPSALGLAGALLLDGIGLGLANTLLQTAAIEAVAPRDAGVGAGLFSRARYSGSIGAALLLAALLGDGGAHALTFFAVAGARGRGRRALRGAARPLFVSGAFSEQMFVYGGAVHGPV